MVNTISVDMLSLVERYTSMKRRAGTKGGEYHGACPVCGGVDRFHVWPSLRKFWCRQCGANGDPIAFVMFVQGVDFRAAVDQLRLDLPKRQPRTVGTTALKPAPEPAISLAPQAATAPDWQQAARVFCQACEDRLWSKEGRAALDYLMKERHLSDVTIAAAGLGLNPAWYKGQWGETEVKLPRGIVIPWYFDNFYWNVRIRRPNADLTPDRPHKYISARGVINSMYRFQTVRPGKPVVMVEGEFDALLLRQIAADSGIQAAAVATGSIAWSRRMDWIIRLALADRVFVAFDRETEAKKIDRTEQDAGYWLRTLAPKARRLLPTQHDITDMVSAGDSVGLWLADGLGV